MKKKTIEESIKIYNEVYALIETFPEQIVHAVLGITAPSALKVDGPEVTWQLHIRVIAWRFPGEEVRNKEMIVSKLMSPKQFYELQAKVDSQSVIAFKAKVYEDSPLGNSRAVLTELLNSPNDEVLNKVLLDFQEEYQKPVEMFDPYFGKLTLCKSLNSFEREVEYLGSSVELSIHDDDDDDLRYTFNERLEIAKTLMKDIEKWSLLAKEFAALKLIELKNSFWLGEGESAVNKDEFISRLKISSITIYIDGSFDITFTDGNLFFGHLISVSGSLSEGLTQADMLG
jgi:hypothetical protein